MCLQHARQDFVFSSSVQLPCTIFFSPIHPSYSFSTYIYECKSLLKETRSFVAFWDRLLCMWGMWSWSRGARAGIKAQRMQSLHHYLAPFMRQKLCPKRNGNKKMDCDLHDYIQYFHWDFHTKLGGWGSEWRGAEYLYVKEVRRKFRLFT